MYHVNSIAVVEYASNGRSLSVYRCLPPNGLLYIDSYPKSYAVKPTVSYARSTLEFQFQEVIEAWRQGYVPHK